MSDFTREYKPGEILYGRFDYTQLYWAAVLEDRQEVFDYFLREEQARSNCPKELREFKGKTFKELSTDMARHAKAGQTHAVISYFHKGFKETETPEQNLQRQSKPANDIPPRYATQKAQYHAALYGSHFSPFACVQIDRDTGAAGVGKVQNYDKYLRRASKFGAINVGHVLKVRVHFALDEINPKDVLEKKLFPEKPGSADHKIPITTSELRALFRNWGSARDHVLFYDKQSRVPPPWEANPKDWALYAQQRCAKYAELLKKQKKAESIIKFDDLQDPAKLNRAADEMRMRVTGEKPW